MKKIAWKGGTLLAPVPAVLVSCGDMEHSNLLTIAWTGIINSIPPKTYISVRPERYSHSIIKNSGEFVINLTTADLIFATDFCGVKSGKDLDKFTHLNLHKQIAQTVACPLLAESPVSIECKVFEIKQLGSHDMFLADITAVNVEESLVDENDKLHLDKCGLAAYSHGEYFELGKKLGKFGFSVTKKKR